MLGYIPENTSSAQKTTRNSLFAPLRLNINHPSKSLDLESNFLTKNSQISMMGTGSTFNLPNRNTEMIINDDHHSVMNIRIIQKKQPMKPMHVNAIHKFDIETEKRNKYLENINMNMNVNMNVNVNVNMNMTRKKDSEQSNSQSSTNPSYHTIAGINNSINNNNDFTNYSDYFSKETKRKIIILKRKFQQKNDNKICSNSNKGGSANTNNANNSNNNPNNANNISNNNDINKSPLTIKPLKQFLHQNLETEKPENKEKVGKTNIKNIEIINVINNKYTKYNNKIERILSKREELRFNRISRFEEKEKDITYSSNTNINLNTNASPREQFLSPIHINPKFNNTLRLKQCKLFKNSDLNAAYYASHSGFGTGPYRTQSQSQSLFPSTYIPYIHNPGNIAEIYGKTVDNNLTIKQKKIDYNSRKLSNSTSSDFIKIGNTKLDKLETGKGSLRSQLNIETKKTEINENEIGKKTEINENDIGPWGENVEDALQQPKAFRTIHSTNSNLNSWVLEHDLCYRSPRKTVKVNNLNSNPRGFIYSKNKNE